MSERVSGFRHSLCFRNLHIKGSHLCPLTPGCFSGVCWTYVSSVEECGEGRCCRDSPLPGWARPKTLPPQYSAGAHLWTSPWAWTEIRTIQNMIMAMNCLGKSYFKKNLGTDIHNKVKKQVIFLYIAKEILGKTLFRVARIIQIYRWLRFKLS